MSLRSAAPWPVDKNCPAERHNMISVARGDRGQIKCICPHAQELMDRYRSRRRERYIHADLKNPSRRGRPPKEAHISLDRTALIPPLPFTGGECRTVRGLKVMDTYTDNPNTDRTRDAARKVCRNCPVYAGCLEWVTRAEQPAGAWHGMIAGMTRNERATRRPG